MPTVAEVELSETCVSTAGFEVATAEGSESDKAPLLSKEGVTSDESTRTTHVGVAVDAGSHVHPPPNSSYSRDGRKWASKLVFSWVNPVLNKSRGNETLQLEDTLLLPPELTAGVLSERFRAAWEASLRKGRPSLTRTFRALFYREFFMAGVFRLLTEMAKMAAPVVLREIILFVEGKSTAVPNTVVGGLELAVVMLLLQLLKASTLQHFIHGVFVVGAGVNSLATVAVYDKALRLSRASLEGSRLGQVLNFQAKDASKLREFVVFFHNLWAAPLTAFGCTLLLLRILGASALIGITMIPVLIPFETWVAKRSATYRKGVLKVADKRVSLVSEIVDGIKTVKLNSLGEGLRSRIEALRTEELASIRQALTLNAYNQAVMRSSPIVVALVTFAAYAFTGHKLDAQTAFTSLALFGTIGHPFHVLPKAIQLLADAKVSLQRLEQFLLEKENERLESTMATIGSDGRGGGSDESDNSREHEAPKVVLRNARFGPVAGDPCLEHVTAEMHRGLSVIVGPVGSGKSLLLQGLVEHLPPRRAREQGLDEEVRREGGDGEFGESEERQVKVLTSDSRVAFCPDLPWIVNASARENICLGSPVGKFDEGMYRKCVEACALEEDFNDWPKGDETIIGAKGITVSGGQRSRIALARAMYARCSVVVLDDPLSALDNIVGNWVFKHAVLEMATEAAVVMTSHQLQYMRRETCRAAFSLDQGTLAVCYLEDDGRSEGKLLDAAGGPNVGFEAEDHPSMADPKGQDMHLSAAAQTPLLGEQPTENGISRLSAKVDSDRSKGGVSKAVYIGYLKACGLPVVFLTLAVSALAQVVGVSKEIVLAFWSDSPAERSGVYLTWYSSVCLSVVAMNVSRFFTVCWLGLRGSESLHKFLLRKVMGAPLSFFQTTDNGRITSRFASDFDSIDLVIPTSLSSFMDAALAMLGAVGVVIGTSPAVLVFVFPISLAYIRIQRTYRAAAKELKRLDSATKSPIYSHFQETLDGLSSIQAYAIERTMRTKNVFMVDANARARLTWDAANRWLGIRLDFLGALVVFLATLMAVVARKTSPGVVGLGLSYALTITQTLSFGVRSSTALENHFNSVERVQEFSGLRQEEEEEELEQIESRGAETRCPWPSKGLEMRGVYARHRPDLPPALRGINLSVRCGERVGICGRSGSGKSSLALALVRVIECVQGSILVDGQDTKALSLARLRSGVTVISQDAHLFSGSVREAIDMVGQCSDARIWEIIDMVGLKDAVANMPLGLNSSLSERGSNLSAGQRQLLCIARAMVNQPGVLIFDEATANVDAQTDGLIRQLIRSHLQRAAKVIIAHRLEDVVSCHRVLVMSAGSIVEEGEPSKLLNDDGSMLSLLARELGPELELKLQEQCVHIC